VRGRRPALALSALAGLTLLVAGPPGAAQDAPASPRILLTLNDGWRYTDGPLEGAEAPDYDDGGWAPVDLPHTWNADDAYAEAEGYRRGVGWYRRPLELDPSLAGKRLFLRFEGANQVAHVWVNGREAGRHVGGYTAFVFDVTELVRPEGPNVVAVRVDNAHDPDIPPLDADFTFFGGIYRDVWLIATEPVHVTLLDHASPGIFVDTPEVGAERASVRVRGTLVNATGASVVAEVTSRVLDPAGAEVAVARERVVVPASGRAPFTQTGGPVERPLLWAPATPHVYRVVTEVRAGGALVDRVVNPLGFRWFDVDPARGFVLNGEPLRLVGTNRHQDRDRLGAALSDAMHREDVRLVKETGFTFLRLAHYPQDEAVLEAMDAAGLVGWEEIPVVNQIGTSAAFADHAESMLVEMIRQHYNHPSILFWGFMNEVLLRPPDPLPEGYRASVLGLARRLDARAKAEDPSRATVMAISFDEIDDGSGVQDVTDVLGLNLYFGWYYRTLEGLGAYLDSLHARHPGRPLMISEYGAGSDERIHAREPVPFDFSAEHQRRFHESYLRQLGERPWLVAIAVWNQFDFASKGRHDSKPNINQKGLLHLDRTPKDVWHLYRARLVEDEPVLHVAARDWPRRAGSRPGDERHEIVVYSNLPEVELALNGRSLGREVPVEGAARWTVPLEAGVNRLVARGAWRDEAVVDAFTVRWEDRAPLFSAGRGEIAVNAGGAYQYVDAAGTSWEADRPFEPGGWGHEGGTAELRHHRVDGTAEDALFQASREGETRYRFDVPDGDYEVTVGMVEMVHAEAGRRRFDVRVNGRPALTGLDLAARPGRWRAFERTVRATAVEGGGVVIELSTTVGAPTVAAIRVRSLRAGGP
jgi:beta-galactosidase